MDPDPYSFGSGWSDSTEDAVRARRHDMRTTRTSFRPGAWLADRRVNTKLMLLMTALLLVAGSVGGLAIVQLGSVNSAAQSIYTDGAVPLNDLATARQANSSMRQRVLLHLAGP